MNFNGTISGNVYAQPLYVEGGPDGGAKVIVATESNNIYALDAITGTVIWQRNVGPSVTSGLPCGNISPLGITGTPVVDLPSRSLFFDAMINGAIKKHFIYSLNVDTGAINPGWPVDVNATATYNGMTFTSLVQNQRAALGLVNGVVYVPYSGHFGDCGTYHGWVVGVPINNPASVTAWATTLIGGGIWGHGGVASDGTNMFVITGNTFNAGGIWGGGEAIIRLQAGPIFSGNTTDYWAPINWLLLDNGDTDLGGCSAVLIDVPGATPSQLVLALGKDGNAYLLRRSNLGGITAPVASANVASSVRGQSAATYRTPQGTYFVFRNGSSSLSAYKVTATNPPAIVSAWSVSQTGKGSPWVTTTNGTNNAIVWVVGTEGDQRLHGYDGDTGAVIYAGGGPNELMANTRKWNTGIVARGRIYFAADNKVYAFAVSTGTPTPTPTPTPTVGGTPVAPSNLVATAVSSSQINLSWSDNSNNETGFVIQRTQDPTKLWNSVTTVGANVTSYSNTGLYTSTTYYYRVQAINSAGGSTWSNTASAKTPSQSTPTPTPTPGATITPTPTPTATPTATATATPTPTVGGTPVAPSNLVATAVSSSQINLSWSDNSNNETGFVIQRTQDPTKLWNSVTTVGANVTSYSNTGLYTSTTYFYRVQAINSAGGSTWSNTASAKTPSQSTPTPTPTPGATITPTPTPTATPTATATATATASRHQREERRLRHLILWQQQYHRVRSI